MDSKTTVYYTVDTELNVALYRRGWSAKENYDLAIEANTPQGSFGLSYQLKTLNAHGLKAIFFVDPMPALVYGLPVIAAIVQQIVAAGHEVQLHIHTEWLDHVQHSPVAGRSASNIGDFSLADQRVLIELAASLLVQAGAPRPVAFRAGNFGANDDTVRALAELGIVIDSSYNAHTDRRVCQVSPPPVPNQPYAVGTVTEVPVTVFDDGSGLRPAQLCALSANEMNWLITTAIKQDFPVVTLVSHSFELINREKRQPHHLNVARFHTLCEHLETLGCSQHVSFQNGRAPVAALHRVQPLRSQRWRTAQRQVEQLYGRLRYE